MALDPETGDGLFPDTYVAPFVKAEGVAEVAAEVIASFDEFESIATAQREAGLRITYVFETRPFDPDKEEFKPHTIAKVTKASPLWRELAETDLVIAVRQTFWDAFDDVQRRAVLHHELTHIEVDEPGADGIPKVSLRPHDVEDFNGTMRRFGPVIPGRRSFVKAYLAWQHEQDGPAPTPLRPVEDVGAQVVDAMMDAAETGVSGLETLAADFGPITISSGERTVTVGQADAAPTFSARAVAAARAELDLDGDD